MGAIYPLNRPTVGAAPGALQRVVWNVDIENYLVTFDAIRIGILHETVPLSLWCHPTVIVPRNSKPDESKWQGSVSDTK